jgi:thioesterase domain-containing protein
VVVRYRRRLFSLEDVDGLIAGFEHVLGEMAEWPDRVLSEFRMLSRFEDEADDESNASTTQNPRNLLESQLREIWQKGFGSSSIGVDDDFFALGGHSLLAAELLLEVEQQIVGEPLPLSTLFQAPTISLLAKLIETRGWTASWSSLVPIQPAGDRPPLFFVHAHGGNVIGYHDLARHLGPDQPFYGLQAPRTGDAQARQLEEMAAGYLDEIRTVQGSGPYLLGGWCLGGDVAYEMAQQLSKAGEDVALVLMVENPRPEVEPVVERVPARLLNRVRTRLAMEWSNVVEIPSSRRTRFLTERVTQLALHLVVRVEVALARILDRVGVRLPRSRAFRQELVAAAHSKAYDRYQPEPYSGPVTLVRAARQPFGQLGDPSLGWSPLVESLQVVEAPGHRIGLLSEPRVGRVASQIREVIDRALDEAGLNGAGR